MKLERESIGLGVHSTLELKGMGVTVKEAYAGIRMISDDGQELAICNRDYGFELTFGTQTWSLQHNQLKPLGIKAPTENPYAESLNSPGNAIMITADPMIVAELLYYNQNPHTNMDVPNTAYELAEKWFGEWLRTEPRKADNVAFFHWCLKTKKSIR